MLRPSLPGRQTSQILVFSFARAFGHARGAICDAQCTVTVTVDFVCPNAFVAYSVYVVVAVGVTVALDPRTAPTCGDTIT